MLNIGSRRRYGAGFCNLPDQTIVGHKMNEEESGGYISNMMRCGWAR